MDSKNINKKSTLVKNPPKKPVTDKKYRILVIEDNDINQLVVLSILKHLKYATDLAITGAEALQKLRRRKYDLVLMDLGLPDIDGLEVTRRFRKEEKPSNHLIMIALTAYVTPHIEAESYAAGLDDFIAKPFVEDDLIKAFNKWLK